MKQRRLGANGPMVSAIGLGCLSFGGIFGTTDRETSLHCLDAAWDNGITFFDTANIYGMGLSESILGEWLATRKHPATVATKAAFVTFPERRIDNSPAHLRAELDASLKRLRTDHVALFYIHRRDQARPVEEVAQTLKDLITEGKIGGYGMSEVSPGTLRRAHAIHPCTAIQNEYSLWTRQPELGLIQTCRALDVAFVPFSPLARGIFGREILDPHQLAPDEFRLSIPRFQEPDWAFNRTQVQRFHDFARQHNLTPPALALAWVLAQGDHLIPIPGTRTAAHLRDWADASKITLTPADLSAIDQILPIGWANGDRYSNDQSATTERYC